MIKKSTNFKVSSRLLKCLNNQENKETKLRRYKEKKDKKNEKNEIMSFKDGHRQKNGVKNF